LVETNTKFDAVVGCRVEAIRRFTRDIQQIQIYNLYKYNLSHTSKKSHNVIGRNRVTWFTTNVICPTYYCTIAWQFELSNGRIFYLFLFFFGTV